MTRCDYCKKRMWPWQRQWHGPYYNHPWTHWTCHIEREQDFLSKHGSRDDLDAAYERLRQRAER